jgi:hypothetical protein
MRPRFGPAIADRPAQTPAGPSRWTHRVGVAWPRASLTPTSNAIGLGLPVALAARSRAAVQARGIASSPLVRIEGFAFDAGGGEGVSLQACRPAEPDGRVACGP